MIQKLSFCAASQTLNELGNACCKLSHIVGKPSMAWIIRISYSVRVYIVIISKYSTKIVGTQNRQVACVHGTQDQKQSAFSKFKPGPELNSIES